MVFTGTIRELLECLPAIDIDGIATVIMSEGHLDQIPDTIDGYIPECAKAVAKVKLVEKTLKRLKKSASNYYDMICSELKF